MRKGKEKKMKIKEKKEIAKIDKKRRKEKEKLSNVVRAG